MTRFDVGIIGLGAMGSFAAWELARRGRRVVGFDRFHPPHTFGSSHGKSRIIREAYFEHPQYVPLVQRAYELWAAMERETGESLLTPTGGVMIGPADGTLVAGARRSALEHRLPYQELSAADMRRRFPMFHLKESEVGLFEPRAGVLRPEAAVVAALAAAAQAGATLHFDEPVLEWTPGEAIRISTAARTVTVHRLIVSAGAWMATALPRQPLPLRVARQTLFWFGAPSGPEALGPERMPIFIWEWAPGEMFYGFPDQGEGVKVAIHHQGETTTADAVRRRVDRAEAERMRALLSARAPDLLGPLRESAVCLYTNAPDDDFILDRHPGDPRVAIASPCSGHGFKFAPAIGEVLADLVEGRPPRFDLTPFRIGRPALGTAASG